MMAATALAPASFDGAKSTDIDMIFSDVDAEGEEDLDLEQPVQAEEAAKPSADEDESGSEEESDESGSEEASDEDDEEDEDEDEEEEEESGAEHAVAGAEEGAEDETDESESEAETASEVVGAVKMPENEDEEESESAEAEVDSDEEASSGDEDDSESEASSASVAVEKAWEMASSEREQAEVEITAQNNCIFCGKEEEDDPSEEFEEYMSCAVCGDNAHRQCARDAKSLQQSEEADKWRCPGCVENALQPEVVDQPTSVTVARRKTNEPKLTRDLLPAHRGIIKPDNHSIFNTLILDDDPMDGSRSLRKRKASSEAVDDRSASIRKRRKQIPSEPESEAIPNDEVAVASEDDSAMIPPPRSRRTRKAEPEMVRVMRQKDGGVIVAFCLTPEKMQKILSSRPRPKRVRKRKPPNKPPPLPEEPVSHFAPISTTAFFSPFYSFNDRDTDESKSKPYGGILSEADADTSKTLPLSPDRRKFEEARQKAEEAWRKKIAAQNEGLGEPTVGRASQKVSGPPSKIKCIQFGRYEIDTWYAAPYPEEYSRNRVLYICEFCLKYMNSDFVAWRHKLKCPAKHPPGDEIYRDGSISIFEVDGRKNPVYCQNLCLLAKLFLGSKTLYYDVEPFLFYVMTESDELGCHFVGYFSKEKRPSASNNVSCILTLPIHQRKGYGNLLIDFSYLLTRVEKKTGSPEKPLSDMGLVSYRNYWRLVLSYQLRNVTKEGGFNIGNLSRCTGMTSDDIVSALEGLRALVRDPVTKLYAVRLDFKLYEDTIEKWEAKGYVKLNPDALVWTPYIMGRSGQAQYDHAPPLQTVAPREGADSAESPPDESGEGAKVLVNGTSHMEHKDSNASSVLTDLGSNIDDEGPGHSNGPNNHEPAGPPLTTVFDTASNGFARPSTPVPPTTVDPYAGLPPTRFELWPPVPGTVSRRKTGRGFPRSSAVGSRTSGRNTPRRNGSSGLAALVAGSQTPTLGTAAAGNITPRRSARSKLGLGSVTGDVASKSNSVMGDAEEEENIDHTTKANDEDGAADSNNDEKDEELSDSVRVSHAGPSVAASSASRGRKRKASEALADSEPEASGESGSEEESEESSSDEEAEGDEVELADGDDDAAEPEDSDEDEESEDGEEGEDEGEDAEGEEDDDVQMVDGDAQGTSEDE